MNNKENAISKGGIKLRTLEPNILGLFLTKYSEESKSYIEKCVDSHQDSFDKSESAFLKLFIVDIYGMFVSKNKEVSKCPEETTTLFIDDLCKYSMDVYSYIHENNKSGGDYSLLCNQLGDGIDACDLMADFLLEEISILEKVPVDNFGSYNKESQRIMLLLHGDYAERINDSLVKLLKKNIKDIEKRIDVILSELVSL